VLRIPPSLPPPLSLSLSLFLVSESRAGTSSRKSALFARRTVDRCVQAENLLIEFRESRRVGRTGDPVGGHARFCDDASSCSDSPYPLPQPARNPRSGETRFETRLRSRKLVAQRAGERNYTFSLSTRAHARAIKSNNNLELSTSLTACSGRARGMSRNSGDDYVPVVRP